MLSSLMCTMHFVRLSVLLNQWTDLKKYIVKCQACLCEGFSGFPTHLLRSFISPISIALTSRANYQVFIEVEIGVEWL